MTPVLQHGVVHPEGGLQPSPHQGGVQYPTSEAGLQGSRLISTRMRTTASAEIEKKLNSKSLESCPKVLCHRTKRSDLNQIFVLFILFRSGDATF